MIVESRSPGHIIPPQSRIFPIFANYTRFFKINSQNYIEIFIAIRVSTKMSTSVGRAISIFKWNFLFSLPKKLQNIFQILVTA